MLPQLDQQMVFGGSQCNLSALSVPCCILGSDHNVDVQVLDVRSHAKHNIHMHCVWCFDDGVFIPSSDDATQLFKHPLSA